MFEPSADIYAAQLRRFRLRGDVWIRRADIAADASVPASWFALLDTPDALLGERMAALWSGTIDHLPTVAQFFAQTLRRPALLRQDDGSVQLLYPYTVEQDDLNFFIGCPPLGERAPVDAPAWRALPAGLRHFHQHVHDGWTFFPSHSMGPLPFAEQAPLADKLDAPSARVAQVRTVMHNGAGDYLCVNPRGGDAAGCVWWHEDPDRLEQVEFWGVLDAWIGLFLEEADTR
jgi:hypothetical protein